MPKFFRVATFNNNNENRYFYIFLPRRVYLDPFIIALDNSSMQKCYQTV